MPSPDIDIRTSTTGHRPTALWIDPDCRDLFAARSLESLDDLFAVGSPAPLAKAGLPPWRQRVAIELSDDAGGRQRFYVKRFHRPPLREQLRRIVAGHALSSTAGVERRWIAEIGAQGIAVPRVVAFGEQRTGVWERRSALVLAAVPGESLEQWAARQPTPDLPRSLLDGSARFVGALHRAGFFHRDLYLSHLFVDGPTTATPRFCLIDLQRVFRRPIRRNRWLARELAQLNYSTPPRVLGPRDRLRWLDVYLAVTQPARLPRRQLIRDVLRWTERFARHDAARRARRAKLEEVSA